MNAYRNLSDSDLVIKMNNHDVAALEEVYLRYWAMLYQHARKMLNDDATAEDTTHDLFAKMLSNMGSLNIKGELSAYLYRSVRNHVINQYHKSTHQQKYIDSMKQYYDEGVSLTDDTILEKELKIRIEKALTTLPDRMREVFLLSRRDELSYREIAATTSISEETVRTQIKRALKILREKLAIFFL